MYACASASAASSPEYLRYHVLDTMHMVHQNSGLSPARTVWVHLHTQVDKIVAAEVARQRRGAAAGAGVGAAGAALHDVTAASVAAARKGKGGKGRGAGSQAARKVSTRADGYST